MGIDNVHPNMLGILFSALPPGSELRKVTSIDATKSEAEVLTLDNETVLASIGKVSPAERLNNNIFRIEAGEGELLDAVVQRFSQQFRLPLLSGVDYNVGDTTVEFDGEPLYTEVVPIAPTSVFLTGTLTFIVVDRDARATKELHDPNTALMRDAAILFGKPIEVAGDIVVDGYLTDVAVDAICRHVEECGGLEVLVHEDLSANPVRELSDDGVTQYTVVGTEHGNFGIRFKSKKS
jgi:hypothetical protein